jgi:uncharacterized protein YndB with AHSA1/START domain
MKRAKPHSSDSLVFECDFTEPPEKVWRALTEPRLLEEWLITHEAPPAEFAAAPPMPAPPKPDYEILTAEPHRLLRYRWRDRDRGVGESGGCEVHSVVTFELAARQAGGTHLRLTHGEFTMVQAVTLTVGGIRPITSARSWTTRKGFLTATCCLRRAA